MPRHSEERFLPFTPEQIFDLVADVERYPEFLPWCVGARVSRREGDVLIADMMIGFGPVREHFTSTVTLMRPGKIDVEYSNGPFKYLKNQWIFIARDGGCVIDFYIDFEIRSRLLRRLMEPLFGEAVRRMVVSFETRARRLYGTPRGNPSPSRV
jgi:coenzyme Q-binding protein COQ10